MALNETGFCGESSGWDDIEKFVQEQEATRQINEQARIQNEIARMASLNDTIKEHVNELCNDGTVAELCTPIINEKINQDLGAYQQEVALKANATDVYSKADADQKTKDAVDSAILEEHNAMLQVASDSIKSAVSQSKTYTDTTLGNYSTTVQMNSAIEQSATSVKQTVSETYQPKGDYVTGTNEVASLTFNSGYTSYGSDHPNKVWRFGNVVFMQGAVKPTTDKPASKDPVVFATIPPGFRPSNAFYKVCQGSGMNRWTLCVDSYGKVCWSRYGIDKNSGVPSGAWLVFSATWMIV